MKYLSFKYKRIFFESQEKEPLIKTFFSPKRVLNIDRSVSRREILTRFTQCPKRALQSKNTSEKTCGIYLYGR